MKREQYLKEKILEKKLTQEFFLCYNEQGLKRKKVKYERIRLRKRKN